jgi:hypothetical protein
MPHHVAGAAASTNIDRAYTWTPLRLMALQHKNGGAVVDGGGLGSPFYFRVATNRKKLRWREAPRRAPASPEVRRTSFPAADRRTTTDVSCRGRGGPGGRAYASKTLPVSASLLYSKFPDHNAFLSWRNPTSSRPARTSSPALLSNRQRTSSDSAVNDDVAAASDGFDAWHCAAPTPSSRNSLPIAPRAFIKRAGTTGKRCGSPNPSSPIFDGEVVNKSPSRRRSLAPHGGRSTPKVYLQQLVRAAENNYAFQNKKPSIPTPSVSRLGRLLAT